MVRGDRRKIRRRIGCIILVFITLVALLFAVHMYRMLENNQSLAYALQNQLQSLQKEVYVTKTNLPKGTVLTEDTVYYGMIYSDEPIENFITEEQFGMKTTIDLEAGTGLRQGMLQEVSEQVRTVYFSEAEIAEHIQTGDRIDVRIRYGNAEDYTVLSDKILVKSESGKGMILELTEEEILLTSSAITDCGKYKGTKLYVVEYPEHKQMENGKINYIANIDVLALLKKENEEGESRIALEQRLEQGKK